MADLLPDKVDVAGETLADDQVGLLSVDNHEGCRQCEEESESEHGWLAVYVGRTENAN